MNKAVPRKTNRGQHLMFDMNKWEEVFLYFDDRYVCLGGFNDLPFQRTKVHTRKLLLVPKGKRFIGCTWRSIRIEVAEQRTISEINTDMGY